MPPHGPPKSKFVAGTNDGVRVAIKLEVVAGNVIVLPAALVGVAPVFQLTKSYLVFTLKSCCVGEIARL